MRKLALSLLLFVFSIPVWGADDFAQQQFSNANNAFEKGDLSQSQEIYRDLIRQGYTGVPLMYNLGNLYYRLGERGRAILWYKRASRLAPRDNDIQFNLELAQTHLKDTGISLIKKIIFYLSQKELAWITTILLWTFFILLGLKLLNRIQSESWSPVVLWSTGLLLVIFSFWYMAHTVGDSQYQAIVVQGPGEVRNGPGVDYAVGFTIPEGTEVLILNERADWKQVGIPQQGLKGWMPAEDIEKIQLNHHVSS